MVKVLVGRAVQLVRNATCNAGSSGTMGKWYFTGASDDLDELKPAPCDFPFSPPALATPKTNRFYESSDYTTCSVTYADLVYPHHTRACVGYTLVSLVMAGVYAYYALQMERTRTPAMRLTHATKPMHKVYLFGVLGALCNAVSSIDLKGWALLYTLPEQQFVLELAGGLMHFGLFILMTTWISIAQVRNSRGLLVALDRAQYVAGLIATACGCTFGVLEWSDSADPTYGSKNGHYTAAKMISLAASEVVYFGAGAVAAVQLIRRLSTSSSAVTLANGHQGSRPRMPSVASRTKMIQLQRASWTIGRYLVVLSILLGVLVFYRLRTAYERWGYTTYRSPPCRTSSFSYVYTTQLSTLVFLVAFAVIGAPQMPVSSGPTLLTRVRAASTSAWNNFRNAPVSEKQDMEQQWGAAITTTRLDDSDRSSEMVGMHNPIASVRGSESSNLRASEVEARASVYDSYAGRASWVQWDISEPTLAEEAERVQAEESFADAPRPV